MGAWGIGLYTNDFGLDVRNALKTILRLPWDEQRLTALAIDTFRETANNPDDENYTTFWLVLADQLHRQGITAKEVFKTALDIIKSGRDLQVNQDCGMSNAAIEKRRHTLGELQQRLEQPVPRKSRNLLKKPQPLLMSLGDVIVFPIDAQGMCNNPYVTQKSLEQHPGLNFEVAYWGIAVIVMCGRAFDFIAYYTPIVTTQRFSANQKPILAVLEKHEGWKLERAGTCSKHHFNRMQLEVIGNVKIDETKLNNHFHWVENGTVAALNDISIANSLKVLRSHKMKPETTLERLRQIMA